MLGLRLESGLRLGLGGVRATVSAPLQVLVCTLSVSVLYRRRVERMLQYGTLLKSGLHWLHRTLSMNVEYALNVYSGLRMIRQ